MGMSQVDVGGDRYSGSYVSHMESGRRQPTADVAEYLAARMHVSLTDLLGSEPAVFAAQAADRDLLLADLSARTAWLEHDFAQAGKEAKRAGAAARRSGRLDSWWVSTSLRAQSMLAIGEYAECWELAEMLADHEIAAGSGAMRAEMLVLASKSRRAEGQLIEAGSRAQAAIEAASTQPPAHGPLAHAYMAAIAAAAESGRIEDAVPFADRLRLVREHVESEHVRGLTAWSLGNLDFLGDNVERGKAEHASASRLLRPEANLRAWARFRHASASMHVAAGITAGAREQLDRAGVALSLVGHVGDERQLQMAYAELAVAEGDYTGALSRIDAALADPCPLPSNEQADAEIVRATALNELGRSAQAQLALVRAATQYEEAGAYPRALMAWKKHADLTHPTGLRSLILSAGVVHSPQP